MVRSLRICADMSIPRGTDVRVGLVRFPYQTPPVRRVNPVGKYTDLWFWKRDCGNLISGSRMELCGCAMMFGNPRRRFGHIPLIRLAVFASLGSRAASVGIGMLTVSQEPHDFLLHGTAMGNEE